MRVLGWLATAVARVMGLLVAGYFWRMVIAGDLNANGALVFVGLAVALTAITILGWLDPFLGALSALVLSAAGAIAFGLAVRWHGGEGWGRLSMIILLSGLILFGAFALDGSVRVFRLWLGRRGTPGGSRLGWLTAHWSDE